MSTPSTRPKHILLPTDLLNSDHNHDDANRVHRSVVDVRVHCLLVINYGSGFGIGGLHSRNTRTDGGPVICRKRTAADFTVDIPASNHSHTFVCIGYFQIVGSDQVLRPLSLENP